MGSVVQSMFQIKYNGGLRGRDSLLWSYCIAPLGYRSFLTALLTLTNHFADLQFHSLEISQESLSLRKKIMSGPVVLEIKPRLTKMGPVRGNQASYLFFPVFLAFVCVILTNLSTPIIGGLSVLEIDTHGNGTVSFGAWGWCATGVPDMA